MKANLSRAIKNLSYRHRVKFILRLEKRNSMKQRQTKENIKKSNSPKGEIDCFSNQSSKEPLENL